MTEHLQFEHWVPFALERVFLFFANPENLPRIMPPHTATKLTQLNLKAPPRTAGGTDETTLAGVGSEIVTSFRLLPFLPLRARWTALITEFEWDHHFADIQKRGPFKQFHHRHEFVTHPRNQADGTVVRDVIEYEVGFGIVGQAAQKLFIQRQLTRTFAYRQAVLPGLLG